MTGTPRMQGLHYFEFVELTLIYLDAPQASSFFYVVLLHLGSSATPLSKEIGAITHGEDDGAVIV